MDTELLDILKSIKQDISDLKSGQQLMNQDISDLKAGQQRLETKLDHVFDQTAYLTEFKTEVTTKLNTIENSLNTIELITSKNWNEIASLKTMKKTP
ncbi:MAG: hypothetical protein Q8900_00955 [Bacillota bacterium]|nr:hypothetical protein [Bacillota bacterium]